jgi:D-alanyl-D-alanine carboxypeptidase
LGSLPAAALDATRSAQMQGVLDAAIRAGAPDVIAAVITEDGAWSGAAGIDGPDGRLATPVDEFAIASLTKTLTAALIMRLAEEGTIHLDAPLATYMGNFEVDTNGATVRQVLMMRGGLAEHGDNAPDRIIANTSRAWTWPDRIAGYLPPVAAPGGYLYSSPSYELLALAAEQVTGTSYGQALRTEILDPIGADRIVDQEPGRVTPQPWAVPINEHLGRFTAADIGAGGAISCISSASFGTGAGSVASDAPSLAQWLWHLFAGDVLDKTTLDPMIQVGRQGWAYGFEAAPYPEAGAIANSGSKTGYGSQWVYFPSSRAIVVIFVNDPDFIVEPTVGQLLAAAVAP